VAKRRHSGTWQYDVCISHAGEDKTFAHRLRDVFHDVWLRAFVDQSELHGGDCADVRMLTAVKEAPVGLALLSEDFFRKEWPVRELKLIVGGAIFLSVLYNITHEDAKMALSSSPQAEVHDPLEWESFVKSVTWTTAIRNPSTSSDKLHFVQLVVFSAVQLCVSRLSVVGCRLWVQRLQSILREGHGHIVSL
jgi:hypothetical protein